MALDRALVQWCQPPGGPKSTASAGQDVLVSPPSKPLRTRRSGLLLLPWIFLLRIPRTAHAKPDATARRVKQVTLPPLKGTMPAVSPVFVELLEEDRGQALRREILKVIAELGPIEKLAQDLVDEPGVVNDPDAVVQKTDSLAKVTWSNEADDCWNWSCNVQELDEARNNYLDAIDLLMDLEDF